MMLDIADLPQPIGAFDWVQAEPAPALVCRPLALHARHLFTTRHWALGRDRDAWSEVAAALQLAPADLIRVRQVHGASVLVARGGGPGPDEPVEADIIIIGGRPAQPRGVAVQAADCIPLLVADRRTGAVAAAHAGWRGLAARVPAVAVAAMARELGSAPSDLVAAVGPAIGACCYEVGRDVRRRFEHAGFDDTDLARWFGDRPAVSTRNPAMPGLSPGARTERWFFDGWTAARDQLGAAGVPLHQIHVAELCTASHPAALCSYRRDGVGAGRIAAAIRPGP